MVNDLSVEKQIQNLEASKYETRWEAVKGFASSAIPALITFGLGTAAIATVGIFAAGLLGAMGFGAGAAGLTAAFGGVLPAAGAIGLGVGTLAAGITGLAGATRATRDANERNASMDTQIILLRQQAIKEGKQIESPSPAAPSTPTTQNSDIVQGILEKGRKTFSPAEIAKRAAQDFGLPIQR